MRHTTKEEIMEIRAKVALILGAVVVVGVLSTAGAQSKKEPTFVDSRKAEYKDVVPGVKKTVLWGDHDTGPYGAFTKFEPGLTNPMHTHTNEVRIVVLRGAYIYKPQNGKERRVGAGSYIRGGRSARIATPAIDPPGRS